MTSDPTTAPMLDDGSPTHRTRQRLAFTVGCVACGLITLWLSRMLKIPVAPGRGGALLQQPAWPIAIGITWVAILAGTLLSSIVASRVHYEGGLFCACVGLALLAARMGPMRFALFNSTVGPKLYLLMALELLLLFVAIAVAWLILRLLTRSGVLPPELPPNQIEPEEPIDQKLLALAAQVIVTVIALLLLGRSDQTAQALAAVGISSYLAALAAHHFVPTQPSIWFWLGPLVVGVLGYLLQFFSPSDWMIGDARGFFAPLARATPLDYASLGTAGALLGYWTSQRWQQTHAAMEGEET
jgi:hypothetical protein